MKITGNQIILCCGKKGCPSVKIKGNEAIFTFDDGSISPMLIEEAKMIPRAIELLEEERIKSRGESND